MILREIFFKGNINSPSKKQTVCSWKQTCEKIHPPHCDVLIWGREAGANRSQDARGWKDIVDTYCWLRIQSNFNLSLVIDSPMLAFFSVSFSVLPNSRFYILLQLKRNKPIKRVFEKKGGVSEKWFSEKGFSDKILRNFVIVCILRKSFNNFACWLWISPSYLL